MPIKLNNWDFIDPMPEQEVQAEDPELARLLSTRDAYLVMIDAVIANPPTTDEELYGDPFFEALQTIYFNLAQIEQDITSFYNMRITETMAPIKPMIDSLSANSSIDIAKVNANKKAVDELLRKIVLKAAESKKGKGARVEYHAGEIIVKDLPGLFDYAQKHPEVMKFFGRSDPFTKVVSLVKKA